MATTEIFKPAEEAIHMVQNGDGLVLDTSHSAIQESKLAFMRQNILQRPDITSASRTMLYDGWADQYEKDLQPGRYNGPQYAAEAMSRHLASPDMHEKHILDIAAGTGFLGQLLWNRGFRKIDAIDPSDEMLKLARERNVYNNFIVEYFTEKETRSVKSDTYDGLLNAGGMAEGHIPAGAVVEMARCVKPGGIVVITIREEFLRTVKDYAGRLEPLMDTMEEEGIWRCLERRVVSDFFVGKNGVIYVYQKL